MKNVTFYAVSGGVVSRAMLSQDVLFEECHVLCCLRKYCVKSFPLYAVSGSIDWRVSRAVFSQEVLFEECHMQSCVSESTV